MKINKINVTRYRGEPSNPYMGDVITVTVETDSDFTGLGYVSAPPKMGDIFQKLIQDILGEQIIGADPRLTMDLWQRMYDTIPRRGGDGIGRYCTAAIDMALWDIKGKAAGMPVAELLGGRRELVPTYANCAHHLPPDELAERAASYVAMGHRAIKIRGTRGFVTPTEATERVRQVREAIGPDVWLTVDVNGIWDVDTAVQQLKAWEPFDVYWLEEPVAPHDISGYARVRACAGQTYIVGGEQHVGLLEFRPLIEQGAVDIVQPNAIITGGITDWLRVHAFATAEGVPVSPWNLQNVHIHLAARLPNVEWIEYVMPDNALLEFQTRLFTGPTFEEERAEDGIYLRAPSTPGLSLSLDPEVADQSRVTD